MSNWNRMPLASWALVLASVVGLVTVVAGLDRAEAQVPVVQGKGKVVEYFHRSKWVGTRADHALYTVPSGQRLFITDIVVSNSSSSIEWIEVTRINADEEKQDVLLFSIAARECKSMNLLSGMVFDSGEQLSVGLRDGFNQLPGIQFNLRGYTTKVPISIKALSRLPRFNSIHDETGFNSGGDLR